MNLTFLVLLVYLTSILTYDNKIKSTKTIISKKKV